jgi:hypothetical protein
MKSLLTSPSIIAIATLVPSIYTANALPSIGTISGSSTARPAPLRQLQPLYFERIRNRNNQNQQQPTSLDYVINDTEYTQNEFGLDTTTNTIGLQQGVTAIVNDNTKQGLASATFNLVKANMGSGVLALPAGIAAFGDVPSA